MVSTKPAAAQFGPTPTSAALHHLEPTHRMTVSKDVHKDSRHRPHQSRKAASGGGLPTSSRPGFGSSLPEIDILHGRLTARSSSAFLSASSPSITFSAEHDPT